MKVNPFKTSPDATVSALATDSSEAKEISSAFGYENPTFLNSIFPFEDFSAIAPLLSLTIGSRSRTSKTRSKETSDVITSIRTFDNAVKGP